MKAVGYIRVSTAEQGESGAGLEAQESAIRGECERRGWELLRIERDVMSGRSMNGRTGLAAALEACRAGEASGLVVAKLDRLARSVIDGGKLIEKAKAEGWNLVALDFGLDLTTAGGKLVANVLLSVAQWEREVIGERTAAALAVVKAKGEKRIGRPRTMPEATRRRIKRMRARGMSLPKIAAKLNADGVKTAQGGRQWYPSSVRAATLAQGGK